MYPRAAIVAPSKEPLSRMAQPEASSCWVTSARTAGVSAWGLVKTKALLPGAPAVALSPRPPAEEVTAPALLLVLVALVVVDLVGLFTPPGRGAEAAEGGARALRTWRRRWRACWGCPWLSIAAVLAAVRPKPAQRLQHDPSPLRDTPLAAHPPIPSWHPCTAHDQRFVSNSLRCVRNAANLGADLRNATHVYRHRCP